MGSSLFRKNARTIFSKAKNNIAEEMAGLRERSRVPGPGAYARFSDFGNTMS